MAGSCRTWTGMISSVIGIILGFTACIVFSVIYGNIEAGVWAFASGVFAAVAFHLHNLHYRQRLDSWHSVETLKGIKFLGFATMVAGLAGMAWYIFITLHKHIPVLPVADSSVIPGVWAFITAKWGLLLLLSAWHYSDYVSYDVPLLRA